MIWEATAWSAVGILAPILADRYWPALRSRLPSGAEVLEAIWPWLYGVGPPYLALISGAVVARDLGLRVDGFLDLAFDLLLAALLVLAILVVWERLPGDLESETRWRDLLDEPRWTLYRASAGLWIGFGALALGIGMALTLVEWAVRYRSWDARRRADPETCMALLRIASSTLLFALTRNLWVTLAGQAVLVWWFDRGRST